MFAPLFQRGVASDSEQGGERQQITLSFSPMLCPSQNKRDPSGSLLLVFSISKQTHGIADRKNCNPYIGQHGNPHTY